MNKKGIAFQLGIYVFVAVIIVISMIVLLNYKHSRKIIMDNIEETAIYKCHAIINRITLKIVNNQEVTRNVANQALYYQSHDDLELFMQQVVKANKVVDGLHIRLFSDTDSMTISTCRDIRGNIITQQASEICPIKEFPGIVDQCIRKREGIWSEPYYCPADTSTLMISYFLPIEDEKGDIAGVISNDLNLIFLSEAISRIKIHESGFAFIVSEKGLYLTHPKREWVMKRNIFDVPSKIFSGNREDYKNLLISGEASSGFANPQFLDYKKSWFYFSPIAYTNWRIIIVIPYGELFHDLDVVFGEIIFVSVVGILLIFLIILLIFNKMFSPLRDVVRSIQRFSFGEKRRSKKNEVELLNESLEELQFQYGTYIKEQDQVRKDKRKYEKDLKSAKEIQRTIVPQEYELLKNRHEVDLYAQLHPAESIGGDLYDYFFIDSNHILFTMGDVSGKGIPAALFMAVAHTLIKGKSNVLSAKHIVEVVNRALSKENTNQHFLTLFLGILDVETGILDYCNAAHNYPFLIRKKTVTPLEQTHGLPIGLYFNKPYKADAIVLSKGDTLFLYTDGVTDCQNEKSEFYGLDRLMQFIGKSGELTPRELVERLMADLTTFKGNARQADDISLMSIKFYGKYN